MSEWKEDHIGELRSLLDRKFSYQMCADELYKKFGVSFSRNKIAGKAYRLGVKMGRPPQDRFSYPPEHTAKFKELFDAGFSMTEAAVELSRLYQRHITRNMVCGKWDRMGLHRANHGSLGKNIQRRAATRVFRVVVPDIVDAQIPFEQRKTIETIGMFDCRWPVGDPCKSDFFFCGAPKMKTSPYCPAHYQRSSSAYNPDPARPSRRLQAGSSPGKRALEAIFQRPRLSGAY